MRTAARWTWVVAWGALAAGCGTAGAKAQRPADKATPARDWAARLTDRERGFEIARPSAEWSLEETDEVTQDGLAAPLVLRHKATGAQVVLQVAPAVASPTQFAERLTLGLRSQPGFTTSDPEPLPDSESAVGFRFAMGDAVEGRVVVQEGSPGHIFLFMGTWPAGSPEGTAEQVGAVFRRVHVLPEAKAQALPRPPPAFPGDV